MQAVPNEAVELNNNAQRLLSQGDLEAALSAFNEAIVIAPGYVNAYLNRAEALEKLGRLSEAQADRQTARAMTAAGSGSQTAQTAPPAPSTGPARVLEGVAALCPVCQRQTPGDRRFCQWCGQLLSEPERPLRVASPGRRLGGYLLELVIAWVTMGIALALDYSMDTYPAFYALAGIAWLIISLVLWSQALTLGKLILGMRVVKYSGERAGFWTMVLREIPGKFISIVVIFLGFLSIIWDRDNQGWHDKIASTLVIAER